MNKPLVTIAGRSNVGKSTLFNKILEKRQSLVLPKSGTTRDYLEGQVSWRGKSFTLIDTGGLDPDKKDKYKKEIITQAEKAIKKADLILLVLDAKIGIMPEDKKIISKTRKLGKKIIIVANKCDNKKLRDAAEVFKNFGIELCKVSSINGSGVGDLLDAVVEVFPKKEEDEEKIQISIALIGKPNTGKSSILNSIFGEERMITGSEPHTTRDSQSVLVKSGDTTYKITDTAGIRRKTREGEEVEKMSIEKSKMAMRTCDIVALVLDSSEEATSQEKRLGREISLANKKFMIIANKWDLVKEKDEKSGDRFLKNIKFNFPNLSKSPILFTSCKENKNTKQILVVAKKLFAEQEEEKNNLKLLKQAEKHETDNRPGKSGRKIRKNKTQRRVLGAR